MYSNGLKVVCVILHRPGLNGFWLVNLASSLLLQASFKLASTSVLPTINRLFGSLAHLWKPLKELCVVVFIWWTKNS